MPYTLRIVFSGLCCFVPDKLFDSRDPVEEVTVLLRNLFKPIAFSNGDVMSVHIPRIEIDPKNHRSSSTRRIDFSQDPGTNQERYHCVLRFEDVWLAPGGTVANGGPTFNVAAPANPDSPTDAELKSLHWLADIQDSVGAGAKVHAMLLDDILPDQFPPPLVAGRIHITSGALQTDELQDGSWLFDPTRDPKRLARSIVLQFEGVEGDSEIQCRRFLGDRTTQITVGPVTEDPAEIVEVEIKNAELDRLIEYLGDQRVVMVDYDYEGYYDLFQLPASPPLHLPTQANNTVIGPGGCTPVRGTT
jgi:hypothetical protein